MPPLSIADAAPQDAFHRVVHALPQTVDSGWHYVPDTIALAEQHHRTVLPHLRSKSVKDCRLSASSAPRIRSASRVGITGGIVEGATIDASMNWGKRGTGQRRKDTRTIGKNARKRAQRRVCA